MFVPELGRSASIGQYLMNQPPLIKQNSVMGERYRQNNSPGNIRFDMQADIEDDKSVKE